MNASTPPARRGRPPKALASATREQILAAALALFARHGYAGTSVRQLAAAVGVTDAALYAHFPSKQAIFDAVLARIGPSVILTSLNELPTRELDEEPAAALRELIDRVVTAWDELPARQGISLLLRTGVQGTPDAGQALFRGIDEVQQVLGARFRAWIAAGAIRADVAPEQLVWELFAPIIYLRFVYLHAAASAADRATGRALAQQHLAFFLTMVRPAEPHPP